MKIINVVQGSPEWHGLRAKHFTASEAPAMAGVSKYMTRNDLLKQKKTGITPEVSDQLQRIFDRGHAAEAAARPIAERIIGEELYPVTGVSDFFPHLLASLDGQTMMGDIIWEHKHINDTLRACTCADDLPEMYKIQMEQQLLVSGADKCLFMASDGTEDDMIQLWYTSDEQRSRELLVGWDQFKADLEAFEVTEEKPEAVGENIDSLPVLRINLTGAVTSSNLAGFKNVAVARIEAIKTDLQTDQDFADADKTAKFLKSGEKQLDDAKAQALADTVSIDELFRTIDDLKEMMRQKRLTLEKLVKAEKENRKLEIQRKAAEAFDLFLTELDCPVEPNHTLNIAGTMKGKRTISSLQSAADDEVARAKVECRQMAEQINANAKMLDELSVGYEFLFADRNSLLTKQPDDMTAAVKARIAEHKQREQEQAEKAKAEAEAEAETDLQDWLDQSGRPQLEQGTVKAKPENKPALQANFPGTTPASQVQQPEQVTISKAEYDKLINGYHELMALHQAGVDSWSGYSHAMDLLKAA